MKGPGALDLFASDIQIRDSLDQVRQLGLDWPKVDVLELDDDHLSWYRGLEPEPFDNFCGELRAVRARIFFIRSASSEESGDRYINPSTTETLKRTVSLFRPLELAISGCLEGVHFANGVRVERSNNGTIASISSSMIYPHDWVSVLSTWTLTCGSLTAIFIDYDESTVKSFETLVDEKPARALQPLLMEYIFINRLFIGFHHRQTAEINSMFKFERSTPEENLDQGLEELTTIITNLGMLRAEVKWWQSTLVKLERCENLIEELATQSQLNTEAIHTVPSSDYHKSYQQVILNEIDNTEGRTNTQLTLMMQRINQQLAQQGKELAEQSKDLAEQSKELGVQTTMLAIQASSDNASMITLAAVTMFFLPATFISSLFSMGFFAFDDVGAITVSNVVWIYPAIVVPLTITVFVIWLAWIKLRPNTVGRTNEILNKLLGS